jgi:hypothetical protein
MAALVRLFDTLGSFISIAKFTIVYRAGIAGMFTLASCQVAGVDTRTIIIVFTLGICIALDVGGAGFFFNEFDVIAQVGKGDFRIDIDLVVCDCEFQFKESARCPGSQFRAVCLAFHLPGTGLRAVDGPIGLKETAIAINCPGEIKDLVIIVEPEREAVNIRSVIQEDGEVKGLEGFHIFGTIGIDGYVTAIFLVIYACFILVITRVFRTGNTIVTIGHVVRPAGISVFIAEFHPVAVLLIVRAGISGVDAIINIFVAGFGSVAVNVIIRAPGFWGMGVNTAGILIAGFYAVAPEFIVAAWIPGMSTFLGCADTPFRAVAE